MSLHLSIPVIVVVAIFLLIAIRKIGSTRLQIWHIMLGGAVIVLITGRISPIAAMESINIDVMLFLFGMFIVGEALYESGYLFYLSHKLVKRARTTNELLFFILFGMGFLSAILMNDTIAIIGTPLMLHLARCHNIPIKPLLLALAFAVTIGSVMSPIGNPQNLLIALNGHIENPFVTFFTYLALPTLLSLFLAYLLIIVMFKNKLSHRTLNHKEEPIKDAKLARLAKMSLIIIILMITAKIMVLLININIDFKLTYIALAASLPIVLGSNRRFHILRQIDWQTLIFFAAMFVVMASVWDTGFFQSLMDDLKVNIAMIPVILLIGVILSQFISNVPFVALYMPLIIYAGATTKSMMALAAGSTIAGNLFILGAASNVIIIQNAEKQGETITFFEFARIGIPLTSITLLVYWFFLHISNII